MRITLVHLQELAGKFLAAIAAQEINSLEDLERRVGESILLPGEVKAQISFTLRPSGRFDSVAHTASYELEGTGIPLEMRINSMKGYSAILVKTYGQVEGYVPFGNDAYGNIMQQRTLPTTDFGAVKKALEGLQHFPKTH